MTVRNFKSLIKKAKENLNKIILQRNKEYGDFANIADFTNTFFINNITFITDRINALNDAEYNKAKTAIFMIGLKLARIENQIKIHEEQLNYIDSFTDFLGYLELLKQVNIKDLVLTCNVKSSKLHKTLIEYANEYLQT